VVLIIAVSSLTREIRRLSVYIRAESNAAQVAEAHARSECRELRADELSM